MSGGCELAYTYDGWDKDIMYKICMAESGGNPQAVGDNYPIGGIYVPSCGLWQIRSFASRTDCESLKNPQINLEWAIKVWKSQGYGAWSVYTNGSYLRY